MLSSETALSARDDLQPYGTNARLLFALELRLQLDDVRLVAESALTDGFDDKKCDLVYVDRDSQFIVVAQGYQGADNSKPEAPANKASDLNTAAAWLLTRPIEDLPEVLRDAASEVRRALHDNAIRSIQFWYVHNLPESENVQNELRTVEHTVTNAIKVQYPETELSEVSAIEVGRSTLEEWYAALETPILVTDPFSIRVPGGYTVEGQNWQAFVTSVPARWLYQVYKEYKSKLFSANLRGYLGSRKSDSNINYGIKKSAESHLRIFGCITMV
jgi:hypothetical protein